MFQLKTIQNVKEVVLYVSAKDNTKCSSSQFLCEKPSGKRCIFLRYICDGHVDCFNSSDERNCRGKYLFTTE